MCKSLVDGYLLLRLVIVVAGLVKLGLLLLQVGRNLIGQLLQFRPEMVWVLLVVDDRRALADALGRPVAGRTDSEWL